MRYSTDIVIIDLEATCPESDEGDNRIERSNIIEIGAIRLDRKSLEEVDSFSELVKPHEYPITPFISGLTAITPEDVEDKDTFDVVMNRFFDWYGPRNKAIIAAFGAYYDIPLLRRECDAFNLDFRKHIAGGAYDLRGVAVALMAQEHHRTSGMNLQSILGKLEIGQELQMHRAVDDARAAGAILQKFHLGRSLYK